MARSLAARLESDDGRPTVTALPDGSVDRRYEIFVGDRRVRHREDVAEALVGDRKAEFTRRRRALEPGGHATNVAVQAHRLGGDVTLLGHLDDPVFADLPFETHSMGTPARVDVYEFDDGDVLSVERSEDFEAWSLQSVERAAGEAFGSPLSADVLVWTNWTTFDALPDVLAAAAAALDGSVFVFDPGRVADRSEREVCRLFDALATLGDAVDVLLAANGAEVRSLVGALAAGAEGSGTPADRDEPSETPVGEDENGSRRSSADETDPSGTSTDAPVDDASAEVAVALDRLRVTADLAGAVVHEAEAAVAATPGGRVRVENYEVEPARHTGGGDRFDAGLGYALARGWSWRDALRLGNACASRYVATGETATAADLAAFLRERG